METFAARVAYIFNQQVMVIPLTALSTELSFFLQNQLELLACFELNSFDHWLKSLHFVTQ
jgi:hypothetical protein